MKKMDNNKIDLKDYRQPMVTSLGVFLGFLLGFLGQWMTEYNFALKNAGDYTVFIGCFTGAVLLFFALFRMLTPNLPVDGLHGYYYRTLRLYMAGVLTAFGSILLSAFI